MGECIMRVEKLENGYEVEIVDEKIVAENRKPKSNYQDPWKCYAFESAESANDFINEHLSKLKPPPDANTEYAQAFKSEATKE